MELLSISSCCNCEPLRATSSELWHCPCALQVRCISDFGRSVSLTSSQQTSAADLGHSSKETRRSAALPPGFFWLFSQSSPESSRPLRSRCVAIHRASRQSRVAGLTARARVGWGPTGSARPHKRALANVGCALRQVSERASGRIPISRSAANETRPWAAGSRSAKAQDSRLPVTKSIKLAPEPARQSKLITGLFARLA